jgi:hypothetical protein
MDIPERSKAAFRYTLTLHKLAHFRWAASWAYLPQHMLRPLKAIRFAEHGGLPKTLMISGSETSQGWMYVKDLFGS